MRPNTLEAMTVCRWCVFISTLAAAVWIINVNCRSLSHPPPQTARPQTVKPLVWEYIPSPRLYNVYLPTRLFHASSLRLAVHLNHGAASGLGIFGAFSHLFTPTTTLPLPRVTPSSLRYVAQFPIHHWPTLTLLKTNSRIMSFRNTVARRALENVQAYMKRFNIHDTVAYVASAFSYHGEIPFLYCTFKITDDAELDLKKEAGGFKVVRSIVSRSRGFPNLPADRSVVDFSGIKLSSRQC
jgi:hypothetical protein